MVGPVGSGKTSILSAVLGEMSKVTGNVHVNGSIAYVPQTAWIFNATLKQNVLFGKEFDQTLYDQVIEACALKTDFGSFHSNFFSFDIDERIVSSDILPAGDETEIGEKVR